MFACNKEEEGVYNKDIFTSNSWLPVSVVIDYDVAFFLAGLQVTTSDTSIDLYDEYGYCEMDLEYIYLNTGKAQLETGGTYCLTDVSPATILNYGRWFVYEDVLFVHYDVGDTLNTEDDDIDLNGIGRTFIELNDESMVLETVIPMSDKLLNELYKSEIDAGFSVTGTITRTETYESAM